MASIQKRTNKNGDITHRVQVRLKGHPIERASFARLTDAKKWAQHTEAAMREGRHFKTAEAKKHTMAETIDRYCKEVLSHKNNPVNQNTYLTWWKKEIGSYCLADVTPALIVEHRSKLVGSQNRFGRTVGSSTANRYIQSLGHVFTVAQNEWEWTEQHPVQKITPLPEPRGRVRFLSDDERVTLLEACKESTNKHLYTIVVLALSTGARKKEILTLKWSDIDLEQGAITLHETKNGERRKVPLQGYALDLTRKQSKVRNLHNAFLFPSNSTERPVDIRTAWENAVKKADIKDFRFHDLRHSAASYLAMNGATTSEIADVLGHKTLNMVKRYAHLSEAHTSTVVANMNEKIFGKS
jgi:integrase